MAWIKDCKRGKYTFWKRRDGKKFIYNVTANGRVPKTTGGYASKEWLMKVKGVA